jgi:hypothetical protein
VADKRVPVLAPDPTTGALRFATVDAKDADAIVKAGGRVLTKAQALSEQQHVDYEAKGTAEKVVGGATALATGPIVGNALAGTGAITVAPEVQALQQGEASALTGGLDQVAVHHALEATAGKEAAKAYAKNQREIAEANPGAKMAGELVGFGVAAYGGSGLGGAARAIPGIGIGAAGGAAEGLAARALGGVAARGVLGRALATSGELAARGAVEGALYGAANEVTEADLGDRDVTADKLFSAMGHGALYGGIGGGLLGGTGSLAKSAVVGGVGAARGGLSRIMGRGEQAVVDAAAKAGGTEATALAKAAEAKPASIADAWKAPDDFARRKANELAVDALGATKTARAAALEHIPGKEQAVGDLLHRIAIKPAAEGEGLIAGALRAGGAGRADEMLSTIQAYKYGPVVEGLSGSIKGSGARISVDDVRGMIAKQHDAMLKDPTQITGAKAFADRITTELSALENAGKVVDGHVDAAEFFYTRAALERNAYEVARNSGAAGTAYKSFLRELDGHIVSAIDDAAAKAGEAGRGDAIRHWKKEYQLASAAERMAEDGVERLQGNNKFSLTDKLVAGAMTTAGAVVGGPVGAAVGGVGGAVASKVVRGRGDAAAAFLLGRMADMGALSKMVKSANDGIERASKGLLAPPPKGVALEKPVGSVRDRAETWMKRVAEAKADPEAFVDKVTRETEAMSVHAPELAGALQKRMTDGIAFLASKMPTPPPPDPLDPKPMPRLTDGEASKIASYAWYVEKPGRFFEEVSAGKLTFEGIEVAKALMPGAFAELQARTAEGLATLAAQGRKPSFSERQKLGALLEFPATPAQHPQHMAFLQKNAMLASQQAQPGPAPAPKRGSQNIAQRSPLDRLEASGPGRR